MQTIAIDGHDIPYLAIGEGRPLVCVHGTLGDYRTWSAVMGPLSISHRVVAVSLRHYFPERWDPSRGDFRIAQHVDDTIAFLEALSQAPVDLMGHSRGGYIAFRIAQRRPDLVRRLILAEPGGELDRSLDPTVAPAGTSGSTRPSVNQLAASRLANGDVDGALQVFFDRIEGDGAWDRLPEAPRQQLRDNVVTLLGQVDEGREPFTRQDAAGIRTPTLMIAGTETQGRLPQVLRALAAAIPGARTAAIRGAGHWMFENSPREFAAVVTRFLAR